MRMRRGATLAALAALAVAAGCGGGGDDGSPEPTRTTITPEEGLAVASFRLSATYACTGTQEDFDLAGGRPEELAGPALEVLEAAPLAEADDGTGTGETVEDVMSEAADQVRDCDPDLAARIDEGLGR